MGLQTGVCEPEFKFHLRLSRRIPCKFKAFVNFRGFRVVPTFFADKPIGTYCKEQAESLLVKIND
jgi:hypothetical protein